VATNIMKATNYEQDNMYSIQDKLRSG